MSYSVYFMIDTGGDEPACVGESFGITWNLSPMMRKALGGDGVRDWNGRTAGALVPALERAVRDISDPANFSAYQAMNPKNGWGSHDVAAQFLAAVLAECRRHPKATVRVC